MSMPPALTVVQLSCFIAVAETRSFVEAGRRLGLTTSGVSKTIGRLEEARGVRLLNRSTHAVSLTPEGESLLPLVRDAVRGVEDVDAAMSGAAAGGVSGRVRISAPTAFLNACLAPLLPQFRAALPGISLDLRGSDTMVDLADEGVDLALRAGELKGIPGHRSQLLFTFPWVTCASPDYLARRGEPTTPADLASHERIAFRNQRTGIVEPWHFAQRHRRATRVRAAPAAPIIMDDANALVTAALAGIGLLWAPRWLVAPALRARTLLPVLAEWSGEEMKMHLVRREGRTPERTDQVIAFLKEHRSSFAG